MTESNSTVYPFLPMVRLTGSNSTIYPIAGDTDTTTEDIVNCIFLELLARARGVDYDHISEDELDEVVGGIWREVKETYVEATGRNLDSDRGWA